MSVDKLSLSLEHYPMLKTLHANSNMESWSRPRRRKNIKVDCDTIHKEKSSASSQSIRKIVACKMNTKNCQAYDKVERSLEYKLNELILLFPVDSSRKRLDTIRTGLINRLLFKNNKTGPNETCPKQGIIYTQNVQGLSGKDKRLESLVNPIIDLMVNKNILAYCVQEIWIVGNANTIFRKHMIFCYNREEREIGIPDGR